MEYEGNGYIVLKDVSGTAPTGANDDPNYSLISRRGATYVPAVDASGNITWTNNAELENPTARNITGPKGEQGDPGKNFTIKGVYATLAALQAGVPAPVQSDFYAVGTAGAYEVYMWNNSAWLNMGSLHGPAGPAFIPSVDDSGNLSWSAIEGYATPATKNIKGPAGDVWKPTVAADGGISWTKDNTETAPATANIKGPQGVAGPVFVPAVADDGTLSWTPIDGYTTPASKNIMGPNKITANTATDFPNTSGTQRSGILRATGGKVTLAVVGLDYAAPPTVTSITLATAGWTEKAQTINTGLSMVTANNTIIVEPAPASVAVWRECGIYCSAQTAGSLTFTCIEDAPTDAVTVNVMAMDTTTA